MNRTRVLLIDDDKEDYLITRDLISEIKGKRKYQLDWVSSYAEGLEAIHAKKYDACLVDYQLGGENGLDLIRKMHDFNSAVPFILLTGMSGSEIDEEAMLAGAADFLVKGTLSPSELERAIRYSIQHTRNLGEIRELNSALEKRVEERTLELEQTVKALAEANETLKQSIEERKKAEARAMEAFEKEKMLNELKSRFITMASHEFRTPLSTILSSIHLISRYGDSPDKINKEKHLNRVRSNVAHLTDLLNDFLSLEKLESGKIICSPEDFNFYVLVNETVEEMQAIAKEGQKINHVHKDLGGPGYVFLDKRHLKNILINLLSNAIKYSAENSEITIDTVCTPAQSTIEIRDHGIGIPEQEQVHLFERFFRAANVTNIQGTGLGLNIVKKYLDLEGGKISFTSKFGEGTTFSIALPNHIKA